MPIALFPELTAVLRRTGNVVSPWSRLVDIETQLLRRAESAFLTHWFGIGVPERRLSLYIAIRNIDALRRQFLLAKHSSESTPSELSLLIPMAGITGALVGIAMSPTGIGLIISQFGRIWEALAGQSVLYRILAIAILIPGLGPAFMLASTPLLLFAGIGFAAGGNPAVRSFVSLMGELGQLIHWLAEFWKQLSGPRENIRNPLVRRILETLDRFAGLFVQVLGLVGFLFVKLAPLLPNLIRQYQALMSLIDAVMAALTEIFTGIVEALLAPFTKGRGIFDVLSDVLDTLMSIPAKIIDQAKALLDDAVTDLTLAWEAISGRIDKFAAGFTTRLADAFKTTALGNLVDRIQALLDIMPAFIEAIKSAPPPPVSTEPPIQEGLRSTTAELFSGGIIGPGIGSRVADILDSIDRFSLPPRPDLDLPALPKTPTLPDLDALMAKHPRPEIPDFGALTDELVAGGWQAQATAPVPPELARTPASAFAAERRKLEAERSKPVLTLDDTRLRDLIYITVGRILPPALRVYAPDVHAFFDRVDEEIYGARKKNDAERAAAAAALLPQQDLVDSGRLSPSIGKLRFIAPGGQPPDLRAFRDLVVNAMQEHAYLAPALR